MPTLLLSFKRNGDSELLIHGTLAPGDTAAEKAMAAHAGVCPKFGPARRAGDTIEMNIDVDTIPQFTQEDIEAWVDELLGLEGDEEEDDDDPEDVEDEEEK